MKIPQNLSHQNVNLVHPQLKMVEPVQLKPGMGRNDLSIMVNRFKINITTVVKI